MQTAVGDNFIDEQMDVVNLGGAYVYSEEQLFIYANMLHDLRITKTNAKSIILPLIRDRGFVPSESMVKLFKEWVW